MVQIVYKVLIVKNKFNKLFWELLTPIFWTLLSKTPFTKEVL